MLYLGTVLSTPATVQAASQSRIGESRVHMTLLLLIPKRIKGHSDIRTMAPIALVFSIPGIKLYNCLGLYFLVE
jgi:hypothetical protein